MSWTKKHLRTLLEHNTEHIIEHHHICTLKEIIETSQRTYLNQMF